MGYPVKQSQTDQHLFFLMVDSTDHVTGKTGLSPTVTLSKNGAAFGSPSGAVTEIASGWYKVAGNATDSATLGPLMLHATGTGADPTDDMFQVVAYDPVNANYAAKVTVVDDNTGSNDRYTVVWFKDLIVVTSGITTPLIQVIKASDGTDLVASTAMTQIGSIGQYRYNEGTNRMVDGAIYSCKVTATIDGAARTWSQPIGRDS